MGKQSGLASVIKKPSTPEAWVKEKPKDNTSKPARLVVDIPDAMHTQIKVKCAQERIKMKEVTEQLFQKWLDGEVKLKST